MKREPTLGNQIDALYAKRQEQAKAQAKANELKEEADAIEDELIQNVRKADLDGAVGRTAKVRVTTSNVFNFNSEEPQAFEKFIRYVVKTGAFDMIQRRVSNKAIRERLEEGVKIPGLVPFTQVKLSLTKI